MSSLMAMRKELFGVIQVTFLRMRKFGLSERCSNNWLGEAGGETRMGLQSHSRTLDLRELVR